jgi:hypothetical protein
MINAYDACLELFRRKVDAEAEWRGIMKRIHTFLKKP